jgi:propionate CoA-transferase
VPFTQNLYQSWLLKGKPIFMYKALPIDVAIVQGTTADCQGNISIDHKSLLRSKEDSGGDKGGIVIAQVMGIAINGLIPSREVAMPGPLVDCVVVVDENDNVELHGMSYEERHNSSFTGEMRTPQETIEKMLFNSHKIIAQRALLRLNPNTIVNLGIGLPEGVASIAAEEEMLDYITFSTDPGVFGGLPASGQNFGPAFNST